MYEQKQNILSVNYFPLMLSPLIHESKESYRVLLLNSASNFK
jgi:hypothetical protein